MSVWDKVKRRLGTVNGTGSGLPLNPEAAFAEDHYTRQVY
jgi:hypothetical protein